MNEHAVRLALEVAAVTRERDALAARLDHVRTIATTWHTSPDPAGVGGGIAGCEVRHCGRILLRALDDREIPS